MYKALKLFLFLFVFYSSSFSGEVTLLTSNLKMEGNTTTTSGGVSIFNNGMYIHADEAVYLSEPNTLELYGNVVVKRGGVTEAIVEYMSLDLNSGNGYADNLILPIADNGLWVMSNVGESFTSGYNLIDFKSSSCEIENPDWTICSSSGEYSRESKWLNLYNPVFYAGQVPVFYMPYFGIPMDSRRRSGLLPPTIGKSTTEGKFYEQPIYLAPYDSWDLELSPQIRTKRGEGMTGKFRFADSRNSNGYILYSKFIDQKSFQEEYNLIEREHTGFKMEYSKGRIFSSRKKSIDGLYFIWQDYSDVDYIKLETAKNRDYASLDRIITNEFNYYYANYDYYFGLRGKYYKDILDPERKDLLQTYPITELHKFTDSLFLDNLTYSVDLEDKEFQREEGINASAQRVVVPLTFHGSLFDDYLNYNLTQNTDLYKIDYKDSEDVLTSDYGERYNTYIRFGLSTNLTKHIWGNFHNINVSTGYTLPGNEKEEGILNPEFTTFTKEREGYDFKFSQYLYNDSFNMFFSERVTQDYLKMDDNNWSLTDLEHELVLKPKSYITLHNLIKYSHDYDLIYSNSTTLSISGEYGSASLTYLLGKDKTTEEINQDYYTASLIGIINERNKIKGSYSYDRLINEVSSVGASYIHTKKCWGVSLDFLRSITPISTTTGTSSRINDTIFIQLTLNPLGTQGWQVYENETENN